MSPIDTALTFSGSPVFAGVPRPIVAESFVSQILLMNSMFCFTHPLTSRYSLSPQSEQSYHEGRSYELEHQTLFFGEAMIVVRYCAAVKPRCVLLALTKS